MHFSWYCTFLSIYPWEGIGHCFIYHLRLVVPFLMLTIHPRLNIFFNILSTFINTLLCLILLLYEIRLEFGVSPITLVQVLG